MRKREIRNAIWATLICLTALSGLYGYYWFKTEFMKDYGAAYFFVTSTKRPSGAGAALFIIDEGPMDTSTSLYVDDPGATKKLVNMGVTDEDNTSLRSSRWSADGSCLIAVVEQLGEQSRVIKTETLGYDFKTHRKISNPSKDFLQKRGGPGKYAGPGEYTHMMLEPELDRYLSSKPWGNH